MIATEIIIPVFEPEDSFYSGLGIVFTGKSPVDFDEGENHFPLEIIIDRKWYKVLGVDKYMHCPPWYRGEPIGLLVKETNE